MPVLLSVDEIVPVLRIRPVTIYRLIANGQLPYVKIGRQYFFSDENIKTFIARNTHNTEAGDANENSR